METFTQSEITSYRQLSPAEVELMNEGKDLDEQCDAYIAKLRTYSATGAKGGPSTDGDISLDQRGISICATDSQRGFMAVIRGIAQSTTF